MDVSRHRKPAALALCLSLAAMPAALAAPPTASGPVALALAAVVAQYSPLLPAHEKKTMARLFAGNHATVHFTVYSISSFSGGEYDVDIPYTVLKPYLRSDAPVLIR